MRARPGAVSDRPSGRRQAGHGGHDQPQSLTRLAAVATALPGAMDAGLGDLRFWGPLAAALVIAFLAAWPVNRWLIARGRGHAVVHGHH
jgi:hypothetical protein